MPLLQQPAMDGDIGNSAKGARLHTLLGQLALGALALLLVWLPMPLGSNRLWAVSLMELGIFAIAGLVLCFWLLGPTQTNRPKSALVFCVLFWGLWLGWIGFQSQVQDITKIEDISPHRVELETQLANALASDSEALSVSVDAAVTAEHCLESAAYACLFFAVWVLVSGSRARLRFVLWAVALSALAQSLYGSLMLLSGLEWGFLAPKEFYRGSATGTFVNRNHFAGYLELGIAAAAGLILSSRKPLSHGKGLGNYLIELLRQWDTGAMLMRFTIGILFVGIVLSQSRMGNAAILGGLTLAGLLYFLLRIRSNSFRNSLGTLSLLITILIVDVWLVGGWFGLDELLERYETTEITQSHRANMWPDLKRMAVAYQPAGSGLGTFKFAYPEFRSAKVQGLNANAHNDYAQFLIEVGVIGTGLLGLFVLATFIQACRVLKNRKDASFAGVAFAGLVALLSMGIHSIADFNLQIPANAATLVVLMACIWACNPISSQKRAMIAEEKRTKQP